jgi:hypothetical protein
MPETQGEPPPLRLDVTTEEEDEELLGGLRRTLHAHPRIRSDYPSADLWMVNFDVVGKEEGDQARFRTILHDLSSGQVVEARGKVADPAGIEVVPTDRERRPSEEEHAWAVGVLRRDPELARRLDEGEVEAYWPMPPTASTQYPNGIVDRVITVGLRDTTGAGQPRHEVVGVRTEDDTVLRDLDILPGPSDDDCGAPGAPGAGAPEGPKRARVRVLRGDSLVWDLTVVRPSASSGANGSGVELRLVDHLRQRVFHRAHVPILNVNYDPGAGRCGPTYRDWLNEESPFEAEGDDVAPGWRVCTSAPRTILDTGTDGGGFSGVALWLDAEAEELVILSQLRAGWYRYVSEWRLRGDGTILPRFGFAAVHNPCTCSPHTHHAYWRFDFDISTPGNNLVQEHNDPPVGGTLTPWQTARYEVRRPRDASHQRVWRVRHARSSLGYSIVPGPGDGTADTYGAGDVWVLAFHPDEIDDGQGFTTDPTLSRAQLDRFVSGEQLSRADVVVWYGVHSRHAPGEEEPGDHRVGPDLRPFNWREPVEEVFPPLVAPSVDDKLVPEQGQD